MSAAIETSNLCKSFGRTKALDGLDLVVEKGEVHGFLGPNGAGKSTTIRILLGLVRATGGEARVLGSDPWRGAVHLHRRMAYVPGDVALWPDLTGGEVIDFLGRLRGGVDPRRRDDLIERFELDPRKKCRTYSKGNRQKVALVAAFAADVELLILDEPTSGLDPLMEMRFRECLKERRKKGCTILLSSHILAEVEAVCDRVSIVRSGRIVESGTLDELRGLADLIVVVRSANNDPPVVRLPGVRDVRRDGDRLQFAVEPAALSSVMQHLAGEGVRWLECGPPTLEDLFRRHYQTDRAGEAL